MGEEQEQICIVFISRIALKKETTVVDSLGLLEAYVLMLELILFWTLEPPRPLCV